MRFQQITAGEWGSRDRPLQPFAPQRVSKSLESVAIAGADGVGAAVQVRSAVEPLPLPCRTGAARRSTEQRRESDAFAAGVAGALGAESPPRKS